ncbi:MAG: uroporphyrinogen-III synthase [Sulfuricella sp.]|nr:uroporphyrinogen-III synthase [Sulfuricella sp.]
MEGLQGIGVVVTRPERQADNLVRLIEAAGGEAIRFPALEIAGLADPTPLYAIIERLDEFDLTVFISPNAVEYGMAAIRSRRSIPLRWKVAAVGQSSAAELVKNGVAEVLAPRDGNDSEALLALPELQAVAGWRVVIFRGQGGRETLAEELCRRGAQVEYAECYYRRKPHCASAALLARWRNGEIAAATATSGETARNLRDLIGAEDWPLARVTPLFVPHPRIAEVAAAAGWENLVVTAPGDEGLVQGLLEWRTKSKELEGRETA